jgi:DNA-binding transcriptional MocR family regulator
MAEAEKQDLILFTRGNPAEEAIPLGDIVACAQDIFQREGKVLFQYGHYSGYRPLREWIAVRFGVKTEQVLIGNGSMEFFTFAGSLLVNPGETVYVESPSYDRAITAMKRIGAKVVGIPLEKDGVNIEALKKELKKSPPRIFYLIPDFQNPSGVTTSLEKRMEIIRLAEEYGFVIVEDSPYRYLRYRGKEVPSFRELLPGRAIHISSFSKILSPGMRIGFLLIPEDLSPRFHKWSEDTYIHPALPTAGIAYEYCRRGLLNPNIERLKGIYLPRMEAMLRALRENLNGAEWIEPEGGYFISATLPGNVDGREVWRNCRQFGVVLTDGKGFFPDGRGENFIRLPFSALTPGEIEEGIKRLARAVDHYRK